MTTLNRSRPNSLRSTGGLEPDAALRSVHVRVPHLPSELAELESLVASDPKMVKLGTILERRFDAQRRSLLTQRDQVRGSAQKEGSAARKAVTAAVNARRQASEYLTKPFVGTCNPSRQAVPDLAVAGPLGLGDPERSWDGPCHLAGLEHPAGRESG